MTLWLSDGALRQVSGSLVPDSSCGCCEPAESLCPCIDQWQPNYLDQYPVSGTGDHVVGVYRGLHPTAFGTWLSDGWIVGGIDAFASWLNSGDFYTNGGWHSYALTHQSLSSACYLYWNQPLDWTHRFFRGWENSLGTIASNGSLLRSYPDYSLPDSSVFSNSKPGAYLQSSNVNFDVMYYQPIGYYAATDTVRLYYHAGTSGGCNSVTNVPAQLPTGWLPWRVERFGLDYQASRFDLRSIGNVDFPESSDVRFHTVEAICNGQIPVIFGTSVYEGFQWPAEYIANSDMLVTSPWGNFVCTQDNGIGYQECPSITPFDVYWDNWSPYWTASGVTVQVGYFLQFAFGPVIDYFFGIGVSFAPAITGGATTYTYVAPLDGHFEPLEQWTFTATGGRPAYRYVKKLVAIDGLTCSEKSNGQFDPLPPDAVVSLTRQNGTTL